MKEKSKLEIACEKVIDEKPEAYHQLLSKLLLLNPRTIKRNDTRFTAQVTAILYDENIEDKVSLLCNLIDVSEYNKKTKMQEIKYAKTLLELDPTLENTKAIVKELKNMGDSEYEEILRKVNTDKLPIKHYTSGETVIPRRRA
ncbi:MAG: hypothetical protein K9W42_05920 [Candidatus Heimdallarchaeota archaeon]|nr:hypothetical protein [Candidatus Heimdallarchaeota archaeon]